MVIHSIYVGHGDCTVIQLSCFNESGLVEEHLILIDGGDKKGEEFLDNYRKNSFQNDTDQPFESVIITHSDTDHIIGIVRLITRQHYSALCGHLGRSLLEVIKTNIKAVAEAGSFASIQSVMTQYIIDTIYIIYEFDSDCWGISGEKLLESQKKNVKEAVQNLISNGGCLANGKIPEILTELENEEGSIGDKIADAFEKNMFLWKCFDSPGGYCTVNQSFLLDATIYASESTIADYGETLTGRKLGIAVRKQGEWDSCFPDWNVQAVTPDMIGTCLEIDLENEDSFFSMTWAAANAKAGIMKGDVIRDTNKNNCKSLAVILKFHDFYYYTGGDLPYDGENYIAMSLRGGDEESEIYETCDRFPNLPDIENISGFKCGHHGSDTSTGVNFMSLLCPKFAHISTGDKRRGHDRFPLPSANTVSVLQKDPSILRIYTNGYRNPLSPFRRKIGNKGRIMGTSSYPGDLLLFVSYEESEQQNAMYTIQYWEDFDGIEMYGTDHYRYSESKQHWYVSGLSYLPTEEELFLEGKTEKEERVLDWIPGFLSIGQAEIEQIEIEERYSTLLKGIVKAGELELKAELYMSADQSFTGSLMFDERVRLSQLLKWLLRRFDFLEGLEDVDVPGVHFSDLQIDSIAMKYQKSRKTLQSFELRGELQVFGLPFLVSFDLLKQRFCGEVLPEKASFYGLLQQMNITEDVTALFPDILLKKARVALDFVNKSYSLELSVSSGRNTIGPFALTELTFLFHYRKLEGFTTTLEAKALIGGVLLDLYGERGKGIWEMELTAQQGKAVSTYPIEARIKAVVSDSENGEDFSMDGIMRLCGILFRLNYEKISGMKVLSGHFSNEAHHRIFLSGIVNTLLPGTKIPLKVEVEPLKAEFFHSFQKDGVTCFSLSFGNDFCLDLSHVPVMGEFFGDDFALAIREVSVMYSTQDLPERRVRKGFSLEVCLVSGQEEVRLTLPGEKRKTLSLLESEDKGRTLLEGAAAEPEAAMEYWFVMEKHFGPVFFHRLGLSFRENVLYVMPDISIAAGPLTLSPYGMAAGCRMDSGKILFALDGLGVSYETPGFGIAGSVSSVSEPDMEYQYRGSIGVKASHWQFDAFASYGKRKDGNTSFFVFLDTRMLLRIHPAFVITGLMGGFGFRERLYVPELEEVSHFPFLLLTSGQNPESVKRALEETSPSGHKWLESSPCDSFAAVGISFTAAEILTGKALAVVRFGAELRLDLLGNALVLLPKGSRETNAYACVAVALRASLNPAAGEFYFMAALEPRSFLLDHDCHLTGGMALFLWFGDNIHRGDFVVSLGGFHPDFQPPAHYPKVERVGIYWNVSSHVNIKGEAYFALTPSCAMAGGRLEITYQDGSLKAWLKAYANMLIAWHPFSFRAGIGIEIGVSYRLNLLFCHKTISISLGGSLDLWGPPTGGRVKIHLWFITFSVSFGSSDASDRNYTPLGWDEFREMLPQGKVSELVKSDGVTGTIEANGEEDIWVVRGSDFSFTVEGTTPFSEINCNGARIGGEKLQLRPMNINNGESICSIQIIKESTGVNESVESAGYEGEDSAWEIIQSRTKYPKALWGEPLTSGGRFVQNSSAPSAEMTGQLLGGCTVHVPSVQTGHHIYVESLDDLSRVTLNAKEVPEPDSITIYDYSIPTLKQGLWNISWSHTIRADGREYYAANRKQKIYVGTPQFSLEEKMVINHYPVPDSRGFYGHILPHIVLADQTLPWERNMQGEKTPFLALLVLCMDECVLGENGEMTKQMPVSDFIRQPLDKKILRPCVVKQMDVQDSDFVQVLGIRAKTFKKTVPRIDELKYLAHNRTGAAEEMYSVIMANRFPHTDPLKEELCLVHLVSLEGMEPWLSEQADLSPYEEVQIVSLYSWKFTSAPETGMDFAAYVRRIVENSRGSMEFNGLLKMAHHKNDGIISESEYCGPLVSSNAKLPAEPGCTVRTAFEAGRMAALSDQVFIQNWQLFKRKYASFLKRLHYQRQSRFFTSLRSENEKGPGEEGKDLQIQQLFRECITRDTLNLAFTPLKMKEHDTLQKKQVFHSNIKELQCFIKENPGLAAGMFEEEIKEMDVFLNSILLLKPFPFEYLVGEESQLPKESFRYFRLNVKWMEQAVKGALHIGMNCGMQAVITENMEKHAARLLEERMPGSGCLLRSELLRHWPNLTVSGYDAAKQELKCLRTDFLDDEILLVLFEKEVNTIWITEPKEGIHMRVNADKTLNPVLAEPVQRLTSSIEIKDCLREEDGSVLRFAGEQGLIQAVADKLGIRQEEVGAGLSALQFMEGTVSVKIV